VTIGRVEQVNAPQKENPMKYEVKYELNGEVLYTVKSDVQAWLDWCNAQGLEVEVLSLRELPARSVQSTAA